MLLCDKLNVTVQMRGSVAGESLAQGPNARWAGRYVGWCGFFESHNIIIKICQQPLRRTIILPWLGFRYGSSRMNLSVLVSI
jgi:hypothetical protein